MGGILIEMRGVIVCLFSLPARLPACLPQGQKCYGDKGDVKADTVAHCGWVGASQSDDGGSGI